MIFTGTLKGAYNNVKGYQNPNFLHSLGQQICSFVASHCNMSCQYTKKFTLFTVYSNLLYQHLSIRHNTLQQTSALTHFVLSGQTNAVTISSNLFTRQIEPGTAVIYSYYDSRSLCLNHIHSLMYSYMSDCCMLTTLPEES